MLHRLRKQMVNENRSLGTAWQGCCDDHRRVSKAQARARRDGRQAQRPWSSVLWRASPKYLWSSTQIPVNNGSYSTKRRFAPYFIGIAESEKVVNK